MGDAPQPNAVIPAGYQATSIVVVPRPNEVGYALPRDEFDILCEGGMGEAASGRSLCVGCFVGALVGFIGVLATADWDNVWKPGRRGAFLTFLAALLIILGASAAGACIYHMRVRNAATDSAFSRLKNRISQWYETQSNG
jgi:hypothetical protein